MAVNEADFTKYVKDSGLYSKLTDEQKGDISAALKIAKDMLGTTNPTDQITKDTALIILHQIFVTGVMTEKDLNHNSRLAALVKEAYGRAGEFNGEALLGVKEIGRASCRERV